MSQEALHRLEISRKELLDLGLRNPLINHRQRAKQVNVVNELSTEIYRILVIEGRKMTFDAMTEKDIEKLTNGEKAEDDNTKTFGQETSLEQPEEVNNNQRATRHIDTKLQTNLLSQKLQTRLLSIHNDARTYIEEQGVNILYLALGFLHWFEAPSSEEPRRAPLLLIPVEITRASARERFQICFTGQEIGDNLSLAEKLRTEFNIELPLLEDEETEDITSYFESVTDAIKSEKRWTVVPNEITLGFFSFGKFLMYKDLEPEAWAKNGKNKGLSILYSLLTDGFGHSESAYDENTRIDEVLLPKDTNQVKDADSTQILAILDVEAGHNLVLQGPPGTGKSQTITNIIAESIGKGKKVLFVSEKMAALDVVKSRLDEIGLGDAVLELHSHKTNKKKVLQEFDRTLHQGRPVVDSPADDIKTLTDLRDELNKYCHGINFPIGKSKTNFINALGFALKKHPGELAAKSFAFGHMANWTESDYRSARMLVEKVDRHLTDTGPYKKNPFKASKLTEFLPSHRPALENALKEGETATELLLVDALDLASAMGLGTPENRSEVDVLCRAARRSMEAPHLEGLALTSGEWQLRRDDIRTLVAAGKNLHKAHERYDEWLIDEAWKQDLIEVRQHYVNTGYKWTRFFSGNYRKAKQRLQGLCRKPLHKKVSDSIEMIDIILDSQKFQKQFRELSGLGATLFGAQWKNEESDWEVIEQLFEWIVVLYRDMGDGTIPEGIVNFLSGSPKLDDLKEKVLEVESNLEKHACNIELVTDLLQLKINDEAKTHWGMPLAKQSKKLAHWHKHLDSLYHIVRFNLLAEELLSHGLDFIISFSKEWEHDRGVLVQLFDYSWFNGLVEKAYIETPSIKLFDRVQQSQILQEFRRLDHLLFRHNQVRLAAHHWSTLPNLSNGGELHIINREINKKRRHMPIRKLISEAGRAIQAIKPVFMMSPMSIATYVPQGSVQFDLVIFDEASQVKPVDAFGAIIRGKQTVVVGDSKQLPPTSFFDSLIESDDEEDFDNIGDTESILSLFLGKGAPERMLRWHYRSRHDSLIAVSNHEFYDNRLLVFPSPGGNKIARGLRFHHLPETAYERGKTRSNPKEAKAVALAVLKHAKSYPDLTLGVVAFSTAQRDAIIFQLELLRRTDQSCESFFNDRTHEPFFVKNLENVQGDERDVIFISIGYGKTAEGYMAMSFGPLNRDGGERRLNVLISRAKLAMDVFANFTADDLDLNRSKSRGVVALKTFLTFAKTKKLQQPYSTGKEPDSPFEEEVIKALVQNGIEVEPQVGTSGFFIDLGVVDQKKPGRYILGIECDGATYHSSRSARDRDRLRQEVLEGLGWRLHRIWSTDWYRNPQKELERALIAIQKAEQDDSNGVGVTVKKKTTLNNIEIVREEDTQQGAEPINVSALYRRVFLNLQLGDIELGSFPPEQLVASIREVVDVESPIHITELTRRLIEGAGLKRSGSRIQKTVKAALAIGKSSGIITLQGDFIWNPDMEHPEVRDRSNLDAGSKKISLVSHEEIKLAIFQEIEKGFTLSRDDAISSAARALGFHRVTAQSKKVFDMQIVEMVEAGSLVFNNEILSIS